MKYQILSRYQSYLDFGEWSVGTFGMKKEAEDYIQRTTDRYRHTHPNFEMKIVEITDEEADKFNSMINSLMD